MKVTVHKASDQSTRSNVVPIAAVSTVSRDRYKNEATGRRQGTDIAHTSAEFEYEARRQKLNALLCEFEQGAIPQRVLSSQFAKEFQSWRSMKYDRSRKCGSMVHSDFNSFPDFLRSMGPKPTPTHTLDRINNKNPEYSPENCRWASKIEQSANRENTVFLTDNEGRSETINEWSKVTGTSASTIRNRRSKGWNDHESIHGRDRAPRIDQSPDVAKVAEVFRQCYAEAEYVFVTSHDVQKKLASIVDCLRREMIPVAEGASVLLNGWNDFSSELVQQFAVWEEQIPDLPTPRFICMYLDTAVGYVLKTMRNSALGSKNQYTWRQCRKDSNFRFSEGVHRKIIRGELTENALRLQVTSWLDDPEVCASFWTDFMNSNPESAYYEKGDPIPIEFFAEWLANQIRVEMTEMLKQKTDEYDAWRPGR